MRSAERRGRLRPALGGAAAALLVLVAACGDAEVEVSAAAAEGVRFVPQVADAGGDVGAGLSLASDSEGRPHLLYLALEPAPGGGEAAAAPVLEGPALPAVKHATLSEDAWDRGAVTEEASVAPGDVTALAVDGDGRVHALWTAGGALFYAAGADRGFSEPETVASGPVEGPSIALDDDGTPRAAYYEGDRVVVAHRSDRGWEPEPVAAAAPPSGERTTAIASAADRVLVAYADGDRTMLATLAGGAWSAGVVDPEGGSGVRMAVDEEGVPHLAYLTPTGEARHAHGAGSVVFTLFPPSGAPPEEVGLDLAVDARGVHHVAWSDGETVRYATDRDGRVAEEEVPGSAGRTRPRLALSAGDEVHIAWYEPAGGLLHLATLTDAPDPPLVVLPASPEAPTAAPTGEPTGPPPCEPAGTGLAITAPPGSAVDGFDTDCLAAPAGEAFTIEFENADPGVPHNVAIYTDESASRALFVGEIFPGVDTVVYEVDPLAPGRYFFRCDVHPTTMVGTFVVP